jgi:hypothetical protein
MRCGCISIFEVISSARNQDFDPERSFGDGWDGIFDMLSQNETCSLAK